jgi:hypothetical protein
MAYHAPGFWTDVRVAALIDLWNADVLSAAGIARALGTTKSAVIGKVSRLGLRAKGHCSADRRRTPMRAA